MLSSRVSCDAKSARQSAGLGIHPDPNIDYACSFCTKTFGDRSLCAKHVNGRGTCKVIEEVVEPIPIHFSINDRNVGDKPGQQNGGLGNDAAARQSSDRGLDMEGAYGEPESGQAVLSGILTYPKKSFIMIHTYPDLSHSIPYDMLHAYVAIL
jgi:hypothetical protein